MGWENRTIADCLKVSETRGEINTRGDARCAYGDIRIEKVI
ncbi:hypothetical protein SAMN04488527_10883 [Aliiroseovarius crassostreae]|nr:hypothetical protein SAMN04488527_10883 [Aliiroseovarius crassostreae]